MSSTKNRNKLIIVVLLVLVTILYTENNLRVEAATVYKYGTSPEAVKIPTTSVVYYSNPNQAYSTVNTTNTSAYYSIPSSFSFTKDLSLGSNVNPDVAYLQRVLNSNPATIVASTGVGSDSNLTTYFGSKTLDAVMRFQNLYKNDILTPAGLSSATGFVGGYTRAKLNTILKSGLNNGIYTNATSTNTTASTNTTYVSVNGNTAINYGARQITDLSTYSAVPGQIMSLFGQGFHPSTNKLYLGTVFTGTYASQNSGTKINFQVPYSISQGRYQLQINNEYGTSTSGLIFLNVTSNTTNSTTTSVYIPTITTVTPTSTNAINSIIRITGTNFTSNNTLLTNLGDISNIRSNDGKNIDLMIGSLPNYTSAFNTYKGKSITLLLRVKNEYGTSTNQLSHTIYFPNSSTVTVNSPEQISANLAVNETSSSQSTNSTSNNSSILSALSTYLSSGSIITSNAPYSTYDTSALTSQTTNTTSVTSTSASTASTESTNSSSDSSFLSSLDQYQPMADPALDFARQINPVVKFITDPLVSDASIFSMITGGSSSSGSSGGSSAGILGGVAGLGALSLFGGSNSTTGATGAASSMGYFGGMVMRSQLCTCSGQTLLTVLDYATNSTVMSMYIPGLSKLNMNYNIWSTGAYVIAGTYQGSAQCQVLRYAGVTAYCNTEGTSQSIIDTIRGIGTSPY